MMRRIISLTILLFLLADHGVQAQGISSDNSWYWAWKPDTGEVVAYTIDGNIHVLTTDVTAILLKPLDHQIALAMLQIGDGYALYKLDAESITQISQRYRGSLEDATGPSGFTIRNQHLPYVLMDASKDDPYDVWIVDTMDNTLDILHWQLDSNHASCRNCMRLSHDGSLIRYLASPPTDKGRELAELRERTLATGEERVLYRVESDPEAEYDSVFCEADTFGEHWLCRLNNGVVNEYILIFEDGTTQPLLQPNQTYSNLWRVFMAGGDVIMSLEGCKVNCSLTMRSVDTGDVLQITTDGDLNIGDLIRIDNDHWLVFTSSFPSSPDISILDESGNLKGLGFHTIHTETVSEDGHWVVVIDPDDKTGVHHQLWDVLQAKIVFEFSTGHVTRVAYLERGIIVYAPLASWAYFYADSTGVELPQSDGGFYFDILPDKKLLYEHWQKKDDMPVGIYRYDVSTNNFSSLVPGGCSLCYDWLLN